MKEDVQDLIRSEGWKIVSAYFSKRKAKLIHELCQAPEHNSVIRFQAQIREINEFLKYPQTLIEEKEA